MKEADYLKKIICASCGSTDLYQRDGYWICPYCGSKYIDDSSDDNQRISQDGSNNTCLTSHKKSTSTIGVSSDVEALLIKCETDRRHAKKYIKLILDLDPDNQEIYKYM